MESFIEQIKNEIIENINSIENIEFLKSVLTLIEVAKNKKK